MRLRFALACLAALLIAAVGGAGAGGAAAGAGAASAGQTYNPSDPVQAAEYAKAEQLGVEAYVYGYPLLDTERVFRTSTSVNVPNGSGGGPVNEFSNIRRFTNPTDRTVVAPNRDTLYSMAWLSLARGPVVLHAPHIRRFVVFELLDPYTTNFATIGAVGRPPGNYAVVPPGWHGRIPNGVRIIRSPYRRVWVIGRTYIRGAADARNVVRIQNHYSITPLREWGRRYAHPRPRHVDRRVAHHTVPGTQPGEDPLQFFDALGRELRKFAPTAADRPLLAKLAIVGIGPGLQPSRESRLDAATLQGLRAAVAAGAQQVKADLTTDFVAGAPKHNGWLVAATGRYGTDYAMRAVVDSIGLGAPLPQLAIYPFTVTDHDLHPLTGSERYVVHFSRQDLPFPVRAFWSLTLYDSNGFFVPNRAHVYLLNNRSHLRYNRDGTFDVYVQPQEPANRRERSNWLPSPAGRAFRLIMRLYKPVHVRGILSGRTWQPPTVLPCLPSGMTADGVRCAT